MSSRRGDVEVRAPGQFGSVLTTGCVVIKAVVRATLRLLAVCALHWHPNGAACTLYENRRSVDRPFVRSANGVNAPSREEGRSMGAYPASTRVWQPAPTCSCSDRYVQEVSKRKTADTDSGIGRDPGHGVARGTLPRLGERNSGSLPNVGVKT